MTNPALLLSIRPEFVWRVLDGTKTVELRRVRPKIGPGDPVLVYASSPVKALVGVFAVAEVIEDHPAALWEAVGGETGVTAEQFDAYFSGASVAYGIRVETVHRFPKPVHLTELRRRFRGFQPPQCYCYLVPRRTRALMSLAEVTCSSAL